MRFKVVLRIEKEYYGDRLPVNYAYEFSSWIYKVLANAETVYASWLHDNGFRLGGKVFKGFTFSRLIVPDYRISGDRLQIKSDQIALYISFLPEKSTEQFVKGLFSEQGFRIGDVKSRVAFRVKQVELMPPMIYKPVMEFETLSPMTISIKEEGRVTYLSPEHSGIGELIQANLLNRYKAFYREDFTGTPDIDFTLLNIPKPVLITFKAGMPEQTKVKGYNCRFRLKAPQALMRIAYEAGIGEKGSQGFGMIAELQGGQNR